MNPNGTKGFGNGRFARARRHGGFKDARGAESVLPAPAARPLHRTVREILEGKIGEKVADMGENPIKVEHLFPAICESCDEASWQEPMSDPIDKEALRIKIQQCVQDAVTRNHSSITDDQGMNLANELTEELSTVIPKAPRSRLRDPVNAKGAIFNKSTPYTKVRNWKVRRKGDVQLPHVLNSDSFSAENPPSSVFPDSVALLSPSAMPSVFPENCISPVRCVVFENLPEKYYDEGRMKQQLESICVRIPGASFLNFLCLPAEGFVIVSFNSNVAASSVMFLVNSSSIDPAVEKNCNAVRVVPALENQQLQLWSSLAEKTKTLEQQWSKWCERCEIYVPCEARRLWRELRDKVQMVNEELPKIASIAAKGPLSEDQLNKKLFLLDTLLKSNQHIRFIENHMRVLYGEEYMHQLSTGPIEPKYSSSASRTSKPQNLIFISELPKQLDDDAVLQFLRILSIRPVHIWRAPLPETTLCVELENIGQVFAVLRQLDATEMRFGGALFSRKL